MLASLALNGFQGRCAPRSAIEAADLVVDNILTIKTKESLQRRCGEGRVEMAIRSGYCGIVMSRLSAESNHVTIISVLLWWCVLLHQQHLISILLVLKAIVADFKYGNSARL